MALYGSASGNVGVSVLCSFIRNESKIIMNFIIDPHHLPYWYRRWGSNKIKIYDERNCSASLLVVGVVSEIK